MNKVMSGAKPVSKEKLLKRYPYANEYDEGNGKRRMVLGGIPNVPIDASGKLEPLDNKIKPVATDTKLKYVVDRAPAMVQQQEQENLTTVLAH